MINISPLAVAALATAFASASSSSSASRVLLPSSYPYPAVAFASPPPPVGSASASSTSSRLSSSSSSSSYVRRVRGGGGAVAGRGGRAVSPLGAGRDPNNPLGGLGDMASSIFSSVSGGGSGPNPDLDAEISSIPARSWDEIRSDLKSVQTPSEREFRANLPRGYGPPSPLHALRLYDPTNDEKDVRVTLYRDSASWCPYCQKVWMALEEKRVPYRVEKINMRCYGEKPPDFAGIQPSGQIPVAVIDGTVYNQSNDIMYALESKFPDSRRLLPDDDDPRGRERAKRLLRLERELFSAWMRWLTGPARNRGEFVEVLRDVERELDSSEGGGGGGEFFLGGDVSLVDFMYAPFLERMAASAVYFKGYKIRVPKGEKTDYPAVNRWFDAMETLESYRLTKSDYYTHGWDLPPQLGGCTSDEGSEPYRRAVDGERSIVDPARGSWDLPLEPHNGGIEPDWDWCGDDGAALREAAERLSHNRESVVRFAARGAGRRGLPSYSAPLSDPNAVPSEAVTASVDAVLRVVASAMLDGTDVRSAEMSTVAEVLAKEGGRKGLASDVAKSLSYLRDRVGVPRDMSLPAARRLRAHLNWAIGAVLDAADGA